MIASSLVLATLGHASPCDPTLDLPRTHSLPVQRDLIERALDDASADEGAPPPVTQGTQVPEGRWMDTAAVYPNSQRTLDITAIVLEEESSIEPRVIAQDCILEEQYGEGSTVTVVGYGATNRQGTQARSAAPSCSRATPTSPTPTAPRPAAATTSTRAASWRPAATARTPATATRAGRSTCPPRTATT